MVFIKGTKEWIGKNAYRFLDIRTKIEQKLISLGYDYFYGGSVSKRSIYEEHSAILGLDFSKILVDFSLNENEYIFSPEYTFRVYEYLVRNNLLTNTGKKIFYSQEMMRNESIDDIQKGKTFSFWQIGYEIFGRDDTELSMECMSTLIECLSPLLAKNLYYRITDKRIFYALCEKHFVTNKTKLISLLEECNENSEIFYQKYIEKGGNVKLAKELEYLLSLSESGNLTFEILEETINQKSALEPIKNLQGLYNKIKASSEHLKLKIVPVMPKTWEAYTTFICDARLEGYDKAIAGGGNLFINPLNPNCVHSGAGIGITRIAEYLNNEIVKNNIE